MGVRFFDYDSAGARVDAADGRATVDAGRRAESTRSDPSQAAWADAVAVSGPINLGLIDDTLARTGTDPAEWALLLGRSPADVAGAEARDLARPAAAAQYLVDHWDAWGLPDGLNQTDLADPSMALPPEAREILRYIGQNPALFSAMDSGGGRGVMNDGDIWRFDAADFAARARDDVAQASACYAEFLVSHPGADAATRTIARDAALLLANQGILAAAGPAQFGAAGQRPVTGGFGVETLTSLDGNAGLSGLLSAAARRVAESGLVDRLGGGPGASVDADALARWLADPRG